LVSHGREMTWVSGKSTFVEGARVSRPNAFHKQVVWKLEEKRRFQGGSEKVHNRKA